MVCHASFAMFFVRHKDFTLRERHRCVELDALMNPTLSHYNECPLLCNFFASIWGQATVPPRRGHLFHDLITQVFLRSFQYGIVVVGVIDAFVFAHNHYRRNMGNPGNFGDFMKGRIRFVTAITPGLCPRVSVNLLDETFSLGPMLEISSAGCQSQISAPLQYPHHDTRKRPWFPRVGHLHRGRYSLC